MKSRNTCVMLHVLAGLFKDAQLAYPELKESFRKDYERITLLAESRDLGFFTLDLPKLHSLLLLGLEHGRLSLEGPCSHRVSKRIQVPRLFSGLWLRIFSADSSLKCDLDVTAVAFLRQFLLLGKNLTVNCSSDRNNKALDNYDYIERTARAPTLQWDNDTLDICRVGGCDLVDRYPSDPVGLCDTEVRVQLSLDLFESSENTDLRDRYLLQQCQLVADLLVPTLGFFEPISFSIDKEEDSKGLGFKHGPGAVANRLGQHEKSSFPNWPHKLEEWFPFESSGKTAGQDREQPVNHELAGRLYSVPKSAKAPRLITAEPVEHQWCQQIIWRMIRERLRSSPMGDFIDFSDQDASGQLVLRASRDKSLATVDLSDASDRLTCWTVERMFRTNPSLLSCLHAARTRYIRYEFGAYKGFSIKLKKFAAQGTATTFPVQSIVFLIIALASAIGDEEVTLERVKKYRNKVRVFGDDIIVPTHGYARLLRIMNSLGLKVNMEKSYWLGNYRESCGTDGLLGVDVTPSCPKTIVADGPASCQAVIDTVNNLFYKGYWHASDCLRITLPSRVLRGLRTVGPHEVGFSGLASYSGSNESHLDQRWNQSLHRYEVRVWNLRSTARSRTRDGFIPLLDFFAQPYNPFNPRIVSSYGCSRKAKFGFLWEPSNGVSHVVNAPRNQNSRPMGGDEEMGAERSAIVLRPQPFGTRVSESSCIYNS